MKKSIFIVVLSILALFLVACSQQMNEEDFEDQIEDLSEQELEALNEDESSLSGNAKILGISQKEKVTQKILTKHNKGKDLQIQTLPTRRTVYIDCKDNDEESLQTQGTVKYSFKYRYDSSRVSKDFTRSVTDTCVDETSVLENYCEGTRKKSSAKKCQEGAICQEGACVMQQVEEEEDVPASPIIGFDDEVQVQDLRTCGAPQGGWQETRYQLQADLQANETCFDLQGVNNVVIDCNGHSITGTDQAEAIRFINSEGSSVRNCRINGFAYGIAIFEDSSDIEIVQNTIEGTASAALYLDRVELIQVRGNTIQANQGAGIIVREGSQGTVIENNQIFNSQRGISLIQTFNATIQHNVACNNNVADVQVTDTQRIEGQGNEFGSVHNNMDLLVANHQYWPQEGRDYRYCDAALN